MDETSVNPPRENKRGPSPLPDWSTGLRQLYDAVLDEPLPDSFAKLIEQLDADGNG